MKPHYRKSPPSFRDQVRLLQSRGLIVTNPEFAETKLSHINYYRLSAYFRFFQNEHTHMFRSNVRFEDVSRLYYFDKKLRSIIFYAIEKIEVYIRTSYAYHTAMSDTLGVFGYADDEKMYDPGRHRDILASIETDVRRSKEVFVSHFFEKYEGDTLPVWMMVEVISFNTLSRLYGNLKASEQKKIAQPLGLHESVLAGWLHALTYVRNLCAHHARVWNKLLAIRPKIPRKNRAFQGLENRKIFFVLSMILYLLEKIDGDEYGFRQEIKGLLAAYPEVPLRNMGFSEKWEQNPLWSDKV